MRDYIIRGCFFFKYPVRIEWTDKLTGNPIMQEVQTFPKLVKYVASLIKIYPREEIEIRWMDPERTSPYSYYGDNRYKGFVEEDLVFRLADEFNRGLWPELLVSSYEKIGTEEKEEEEK